MWWPTGQLISDEHTLDVSEIAAPNLLRMRVEVFDASAKKRLAITDNIGRPNDGIFAEVKRPSDGWSQGQSIATLGEQISLLSYSFRREADGASLLLLWRAESSIQKDYTVFVHLLDAQSHMVAQSDAQPVEGHYPTHAWDKGEVVTDVHRLTLAADAFAKVDHIAVGMYTLADGKRLSSSAGGDAILIQQVNP